MRAIKRFPERAFTLVELMIVVAIIGVLAALAIYGVRRYMATAQISEAKNVIGAISRAAIAAYQRENTPLELLNDGTTSVAMVHAFCQSAVKVPAAGPPPGKKYQPNTTDGQDFKTGDQLSGWQCLKFEINEPIFFAYRYDKGAGPFAAKSMATANGFEVSAQGDLDGNNVLSTFARGADLRNGSPVISTELYVDNEFE